MTISEDTILYVKEQIDIFKNSSSELADVLTHEYGITSSTARRYIRLAKAYGEPTPEKKLPKILLIW